MTFDFVYVLISGLTIGMLGSFHCVGMCGPLALALPVHQLRDRQKALAIFLYNMGRVLTYTALGILFGIIGLTFSLFKIQQWLSVAGGSLILVILLVQHFGNTNSTILAGFTNRVRQKLSNYFTATKTASTYLNIGLLNGLLPCGLVYVALAASFATGTIADGALLMTGFGLGTIPIMAATMVFGRFISLNMRKTLNKITPYMIMCVAVLLILRGLNLGIPYISPTLVDNHMNCCHK
jgi:uncharacterized protein